MKWGKSNGLQYALKKKDKDGSIFWWIKRLKGQKYHMKVKLATNNLFRDALLFRTVPEAKKYAEENSPH